MFPTDAITIQHELVGDSSYVMVSGTDKKTIIGISIQQSKDASTSQIRCGTTTLALNYAKDLPFNQVQYLCNDTINVTKTGQDSASFLITYVPRDISDLNVSPPSQFIGKVDLATQSAIGMHDLTYVMWMGQAMIILSLGIVCFLLYMKRK